MQQLTLSYVRVCVGNGMDVWSLVVGYKYILLHASNEAMLGFAFNLASND
jgi:hypothetical protein